MMKRWRKVMGFALIVATLIVAGVACTIAQKTTADYGRPTDLAGCTPVPLCTPNPRGSRIAFSSARYSWGTGPDSSPYYIYVMNADGTCTTQLSDVPGAELPRWSPDGTRLLFEAEGILYVVNADGSQVRQLARYGDCSRRPLWSPDGSQIAYLAGDDPLSITKNCRLYIVKADGSANKALVDIPLYGGESCIASKFEWSPDGKQIAFSTETPGTKQHEVYVVNADGSGMTNLTNHEGMDYFVAWSPDGRQILFASERDVADKGECRKDLFMMNTDGTNVRRLVDDVTTDPTTGTWVPGSNSKIVIRTMWPKVSGVYVLDIACLLANSPTPGVVPQECRTRLPAPPRSEVGSTWPPGGKQFSYQVIDHSTRTLDIFVVNFDGTGLRNLTNCPAGDRHPDWSP